jgi:hypothetical protein
LKLKEKDRVRVRNTERMRRNNLGGLTGVVGRILGRREDRIEVFFENLKGSRVILSEDLEKLEDKDAEKT